MDTEMKNNSENERNIENSRRAKIQDRINKGKELKQFHINEYMVAMKERMRKVVVSAEERYEKDEKKHSFFHYALEVLIEGNKKISSFASDAQTFVEEYTLVKEKNSSRSRMVRDQLLGIYEIATEVDRIYATKAKEEPVVEAAGETE